jgi:serine/threonine/tyrosine-interacting protein
MKKRLAYLQEHRITHIVCVRQTQEAHFVRANFQEHFIYLIVDLSDGATESIIPHFPRVREFLKAALAAGGRVLMHGNAGISRSGALLVSFMMEQYSLPYNEALRLVQLRRFCVSPNEGFQSQLLEYEPIYQAAAQAAQGALHNAQTGAGGGGGARGKRGMEEIEFDDEDDDDDMDEGLARNPAQYAPVSNFNFNSNPNPNPNPVDEGLLTLVLCQHALLGASWCEEHTL